MFPSSQMNPMVSADGPRYGDGLSLEDAYVDALNDVLDGEEVDSDDTWLQNSVAKIVAAEIKRNPNLFAINSDPAIFQRIGYEVAVLVDRAFNNTARFNSGAA